MDQIKKYTENLFRISQTERKLKKENIKLERETKNQLTNKSINP